MTNKIPQKFFTHSERKWLDIEASDNEDQQKNEIESNKNTLREILLSALQVPNLVVLSGSGTSLGKVGAPSMWDIWNYAVNENPDTAIDPRNKSAKADAVINKIKFDKSTEEKDGSG